MRKFYIRRKWTKMILLRLGHFFSHFIKMILFGPDDGWGFFKVAKFESFQIIELRPFLGAPGPLFAPERGPILRIIGNTGSAQFNHSVSHSNYSKGWCPFAKILKSSKMGEIAPTKRFFSATLSKSSNLDETEVVKFASVVKIDLG